MHRKAASDPDSYGPMLGHHLMNVLSAVTGALDVARRGDVSPEDEDDLLDRAERSLRRLNEAARLLTGGQPALALALLAGNGEADLEAAPDA